MYIKLNLSHVNALKEAFTNADNMMSDKADVNTCKFNETSKWVRLHCDMWRPPWFAVGPQIAPLPPTSMSPRVLRCPKAIQVPESYLGAHKAVDNLHSGRTSEQTNAKEIPQATFSETCILSAEEPGGYLGAHKGC